MKDLEALCESLKAYIYEDKCRKIEWFNLIKNKLHDVKNERDKMYILSLLLDISLVKDEDRMKIYHFLCYCYTIYGINAKYNDLSQNDQELVCTFNF